MGAAKALYEMDTAIFNDKLENFRVHFKKIYNFKKGFISSLTDPGPNIHCKKCGRRVMVGDDLCALCATPSVDLKLFMAIIQFRGQPEIEMTILHVDQQKAQLKVIDILEQDGYKMSDTINLVVNEIHGPFNVGFVISRNHIRSR